MLALRRKFEYRPYPTNEEYEELSRLLNTSTKRIRTWFHDQHRNNKRKGQQSHDPKECSNETGQELGQKQVLHRSITKRWFSKEQLLILKEVFETTGGKLPNKSQMQSLIERLKENNVRRIKTWFRSERLRVRKKETREVLSQSEQSH